MVATMSNKGQFVKGQIAWNKGKHLSVEHKKNLSKAHKGKPSNFSGKQHTNKTKEKMSEAWKHRDTPSNLGKKFSKEWCKNIGLARKGKQTWMKDKKHTEAAKQKNSDAHKGKLAWNKDLTVEDKRVKQYVLNSIKTKGKRRRKTSFETKLEDIICRNSLPYKYVGDGSFLIGFLNPDFVNVNGEKICIEVYYSYYKNKSFGSEENYQNWRNNWLNKYGWNAIYLNEQDMKQPEEIIINKIVSGGD